MTERRATLISGILLLASIALAVAGGVLHYLTRDVAVEYYGARGFQGVFGVIFAAIGWMIARNRGHSIGWIFLAVGLVSTLQSFDSGYATYSVAQHGGSLPLTDLFVWLAVWVWVLIVGPLITIVLLLFPDGRFETRRQRIIAGYATFAIGVFALSTAFTPGQAGEMPEGVRNPYTFSKGIADALGAASGLLFVAAVIACVSVLVARFRRARGERRQQMKWLMFAASLAAVALSVSIGFLVGGGDGDATAVRVSSIAVIVGFSGIPVATGVAVLRYGLYEIDVVINKTIVYAMLAVFITLVYVAVVVGIGAIVGSGADTGLAVAATAVVALAVQPVRVRANHLANRLVFGKRATPYEALSGFSARLSEQTDAALPRLARSMTEATAADRGSVWLGVGDQLRPAGVWPPDVAVSPVEIAEPLSIPGWDRVYPVRHEGELLGAVAVSTPPNDPLKPVEERLLSDLASQAGLLLRNARLIEELRASRQRLVAAQDHERRRIERDLHDGAQQHLVALAVNLKMLQNFVTDPPEARALVESLQANTSEALDELRTLARGIYPPLLADRGLVEALRAQVARAAVPVELIAGDVGRYPIEVESAIYFCVLEALQNVAKYGQAQAASVRIWRDDGLLSFSVSDDGVGFDVRTAKRGAGLTNMRDRLDALGGTIRVASSPGQGTTVEGSMPVVAVSASEPTPD